jgi:hypothetical protein
VAPDFGGVGRPAPSANTAPSASGRPAPSAGAEIVAAAAERLQAHASISADVRYRVDLYGQQLVGYGEYYQQGAGAQMQFRLQLRTRIDGVESSLQQVADQWRLWTDEQWGQKHRITQVKLSDVREALLARGDRGADWNAQLAIGGVPGLLKSLVRRFEFGPARPVMLGEMPAFHVVGRWRETKQDDNPSKNSDTASPNFPNEVLLILARDDLFPHVVEYRRSGKSNATLVRLELFHVKLDQPIDNRQFVYTTNETGISNGTERFLREHNLLDPSP